MALQLQKIVEELKPFEVEKESLEVLMMKTVKKRDVQC